MAKYLKIMLLLIVSAIIFTGCHLHEWKQATCTDAKICIQCGKTDGEPEGHICNEWTIDQNATCTNGGKEIGICTKCGGSLERIGEALPHTPSEIWEIIDEATDTMAGVRVQYCIVCGDIALEERYELTQEEKMLYFKNSCEPYSYEEIARYPEQCMGKAAKIIGEVQQVIEDGNEITILMNLTKEGYFWTDRVYVRYTRNPEESRIFEYDIITVYGNLAGLKTYKNILEMSVTVPAMNAKYIEIK